MARIRYIKPQAAEDIDLAGCSIHARYLYQNLWCHMDCQGITEDEPRLIKKNVFPYDEEIGVAKIDELVGELVTQGFLFEIKHNGKEFLFCPTLAAHQKFHQDERAKYSIPVELILRCQQGAGTIPTSCLPGASSTGNFQLATGNLQLATGNAGTGPAPCPPGLNPENQKLVDQIQEAGEVFRETLRFFKQGRTLLEEERFAIGRAIHARGLQAIKLALRGARYEPKSDKFNPADWVDLTRYLDARNFKRFLGYGVRAAKDDPPNENNQSGAV